MNLYTLNEWSTKSDWKKKIDNDQSSILTKEYTDNQFRVFKWIIQSLLADALLMRIHFVARAKNGNNKEHILIGNSTRKTMDILKETSHSLSQAWGNLLFIVEKV